MGLQEVTGGNKGLQRVPKGYRGLHGDKRGYKGLLEVNEVNVTHCNPLNVL